MKAYKSQYPQHTLGFFAPIGMNIFIFLCSIMVKYLIAYTADIHLSKVFEHVQDESCGLIPNV